MKLSEYAKRIGVCYATALRYWKQGLLRGDKLPTGTIIVYDDNLGIDAGKNNNKEIKDP